MDCIFSAIEQSAELHPAHEGRCWHFSHPAFPLLFHHHRELEINLVTQGEAVYLLDDRRYTLQTGTLVWLFPEQNHLLLDRSADFAMWILLATPALVNRLGGQDRYSMLRENNPTDSYCRLLSEPGQRRLATLLHEITALEEPTHLNAGLAYALLCAWTAYERAAASGERAHPVHPAVQATARRLCDDVEPTSLKQLAAEFGLSASRLSTLFKEQTGVPLARYRNQQRLARFLQGREADEAGRVSLLEAALDAGFGSYAQFYRVFCETMGYPPAEHRDRDIGRSRDIGPLPAPSAGRAGQEIGSQVAKKQV